MQNTLYSFKNDLGRLYCLTKNSKIESVFLKLSSSLDNDFARWFLQNRNNIKVRLQSPATADILASLIEIKTAFITPLTVHTFTMNVLVNGDAKFAAVRENVGNVKQLQSLLSDSRLQAILSPFEDVIGVTQNFKAPSTIPLDMMASDLLAIQSAYNTYLQEVTEDFGKKPAFKRPPIKTRQKNFFSYALQQFTQEVSEAARRAGLDKLAESMKNEGLLAKPSVLGEHTYISSANMFAKNRADSIIQVAMKNINEDRFEVMYEYIKEQIMEFMGQISVSDLVQLYKERERGEDMSEFMGTDGEKKELAKINMTDDMWLSPAVLGMLSYALNRMYLLVRD